MSTGSPRAALVGTATARATRVRSHGRREAQKAVRDPRLRARAEKRARVRRGWTVRKTRASGGLHARSEGGGWSKLAKLLRSHGRRAAPPVRAYRKARRRRRRGGGGGVGGAAGSGVAAVVAAGAGRAWHVDAGRDGGSGGEFWAAMAPHRGASGRSMRSVRHHYNRLQRGTSQVVSRSKGAERTPGEGQGQGQVHRRARTGGRVGPE